MRLIRPPVAVSAASVLLGLSAICCPQPVLPGPGPSVYDGLPPPADAVVLFDGKSVANWQQRDGNPAAWPVAEEAMTVSSGDIMTKETYLDAYLHLEWMEPDMPTETGQGKGNSGVYVQGRYEIQVLDSYGLKIPGKGDCGAIYDAYAPLVNACRPPLEWQTFDIFVRSARLDETGKIVERARMTMLQNGIVIHNNVELPGTSGGAVDERQGTPGPLLLQDHGNRVQYRNIWMVPLALKGSDTYEPR